MCIVETIIISLQLPRSFDVLESILTLKTEIGLTVIHECN